MNLRTALFLILVFSLLSPAPVIAQTSQQVARIYAIDSEAENIARQRQNTRGEIESLNRFSIEADVWVSRQNRLKTEIRKTENKLQSGDYNTFDSTQLKQKLRSLKQELSNVEALNGGAIIGGRQYFSLSTLNNALAENGKQVKELNIEYLNFSQQLNQLDQQRDKLSAGLENYARVRLPGNRNRLRMLQEDLDNFQGIINNPNIWCLPAFSTDMAPPFISRRFVINLLTVRLVEMIATTPGAKFNPGVFASELKKLRDQSNDIKKHMRNNLIPQVEKDIRATLQEIALAATVDITGCWVIFIGNAPYPRVEVRMDDSGEYRGIISNVGQLDFFSQGQTLFTVARSSQSSNIFTGYEHSFDTSGNRTRTRLRLTTSADSDLMNYRADDVLTLRRCQ